MGLIAFDTSATKDYTLKQDTQDPTIFQVGCLDSALAYHLLDEALDFDTQTGKPKPHIFARRMDMVKFGIKGWKNLKSKTGEEIQPTFQDYPTRVGPRKGLTADSLNHIKPFIDELAEYVTEVNTFTESDQGN